MQNIKKVETKSGEVKWEVNFHVNGRGSKRVRRRFDLKLQAESFLERFHYKEQKQIVPKPTPKIIRTLASEVDFWKKLRSDQLSQSHLVRVVGILDKLLVDFGEMPVTDMNNEFLSMLRKDLLVKGLRPATVNRWTNSVTTIVNFSFKNNRIKINPCAGFGLLNEYRKDILFWDREDVSIFLSYADEKYPKSGDKRWIYISYLILLNTGIRAGEIWGLKVKDFKFQRKQINIERQVLERSREISATKGKNIRKVPLNAEISQEVNMWVQKSLFEPDDFIFQARNREPVRHNNFIKRTFKFDIADSDVRVIRFHDLRHTALTLMVESGINLNVVKSIAGHADVKTTMKYVHLLSSSVSDVATSFSLSK